MAGGLVTAFTLKKKKAFLSHMRNTPIEGILNTKQKEEIIFLYNTGHKVKNLALQYGCKKGLIYRLVNEQTV